MVKEQESEIKMMIKVVKWVYPLLSGSFLTIVALIVFIWTAESKRNNEILNSVDQNLQELKVITAKNQIRINRNEKDIGDLLN